MRTDMLYCFFLIVADTIYTGSYSKYGMAIHYDTTEEGQNKNVHQFLFDTKNIWWEVNIKGIVSDSNNIFLW